MHDERQQIIVTDLDIYQIRSCIVAINPRETDGSMHHSDGSSAVASLPELFRIVR